MECTTESGDPASSGLEDCPADQEKAEGNELGSYCFSKKLITFTLYGKIHPKSKRPWNETLSAKIANVQELFKNIPPMLYFSPSSVSIDGIGVYTAESLPKATSLGPYFGKAVRKNQVEGDKHNEWLWEVYQDSTLVYYVDASDPKYGNWMNFIQCARSRLEQNLKALQHDDYLYFEATRDITAGEELLVWYDECQYSMYMGIPTGYKKRSVDGRSHNIRKSYLADAGSTTLTKTQPINEDEFLNEAGGIHSTPITSHSVSDTSSASTDDSGISLHFEPTTTSAENLTQSAERSVSPMDQRLVEHGNPQESMDVTTTHTHPTLPSDCFQRKTVQVLTENVYQSVTSTDQLPDKPAELEGMVEKGQPDVLQWQPPTNGNASLATSPKQLSPLASSSPAHHPSVKSTFGSSKLKPSNLLYGMFSRSVDGTRWQCEECKKLFSSQGSLRAHARIHTGERPYQCQYCYRTFCQASTLRSHERLHTGEKPYKCEFCGRAFTQSAGLRSHLKTHRYDS